MNKESPSLVGGRMRELRECRGLTRSELAKVIGVDVTALSCWETGKYLPREKHRLQLAHALGVEPAEIFDPENGGVGWSLRAQLPADDDEVSGQMVAILERSHQLRIMRLSYPFSTAMRYLASYRHSVSTRLLQGSLKLHRVEVFYSLDRLREVLSNIVRFEGCQYWVKGFVMPGADVFPAIDVFFGDQGGYVFSAAWNSAPAEDRPRLWLSGKPVADFMRLYWDEVWHRGRLLNINGTRDLVAARDIALTLGLRGDDWPNFLESAKRFETGDGAPPMP